MNRRLLESSFLFLIIGLAPIFCVAQNYPNKPIKIIIGYPPGGGADTIARLIAQPLSMALGQAVVVENRAGADGMIAGAAVAKAAPDGYTLLLVSSSHVINVALKKSIPYDTLQDFAPISHIADQQILLVTSPTKPFSTVPELLKYLKDNPGVVNFGSSSSGSALPTELFRLETGTKFTHVPYKGTAPVIADTLAGHIDLTMAGAATAIQHVKAGKLRALAVTGAKRSPQFPDTPSLSEFIPGFDVTFWSAIYAPAKTPEAIIIKLNTELVRITRNPEFQKSIRTLGADVVGSSPEELKQFTINEIGKWSRVVKQSDYKE